MKRMVYKITSLVLILTSLLTLVAIYPIAEGNEESSDTVNIVFNRDFEDGWNYYNGMDTDVKNELDAYLTYKKMSPTWYNYYLRLLPTGDRGGYLYIPMGEDTPTAGKVFFELDMKSETADNNIGGVVMTAGVGENPLLTHIVAFNEGRLFLLGRDVAEVPLDWLNLSFEIDFDYAKNTLGAAADEYLVTVTYGELTETRVYSADDFGISGIYIGAQENFLGYDREGDSYFVDNVKLYWGADEKTELPDGDYGTAVNLSSSRDFAVLGTGAGGSYLTGSPNIERLDMNDESVQVHYNRNYGEGWNYDNGFASSRTTERGNEFAIKTDYASEMNTTGTFLNYYLEFIQRNANNGFVNLSASTAVPRSTGKCFFEFDIKASAGASIPKIFEIVTPGRPVTYITDTMSIENGSLIVFGNNVGYLGEEWCHVIIEMDFDWGPANGKQNAIKYTVTVGAAAIEVEAIKYVNGEGIDKSTFRGLQEIRIGRLGAAGYVDGDWYGLDNVQLYSATAPANIDPNNYGSLVKTDNTKDFTISDGFVTELTTPQIAASSLTMKVNTPNALINGEKTLLFTDEEGNGYGAPYKENGVVMVPLEPILDYVGSPYRYNSDGLACDVYANGEYRSIAVGRDLMMIGDTEYLLSAPPTIKTDGGNKVIYIGLDDVEKIFAGYYVTYDEIGFISIATVDDYLNRDTDEDYMRNLMRTFVYDAVNTETIYETVKENTNDFDHPYLYVNQDRFDYLYDVYHSVPGDEIYDADLWTYIDNAVKQAQKYYLQYVNLDENGNYKELKKGQYVYSKSGMATWRTNIDDDKNEKDPYTGELLREANNHSISTMPYPLNNGYDYGGDRLNILSDGDSCLSIACESVAFAYQMTRDPNYAGFVYDWAAALTSWTHWGPAHYLNVGTTAHYISLAYDWLYDAWADMDLDSTVIRDGLNRLCTHTAWRAVNNMSAEYKANDGGESGKYWSHIGNWNPVCAAGVIPSCLISLEDPAYVEEATYTLERTIYYLGYNGFTYFAFDGSYRESSGYWCATIRYAQWDILMIQNAFGTDFGLLDAPGIDVSNYFGSYMHTDDNGRWNYHDDWEGFLSFYWLYLGAQLFDNPDFANLRYVALANGTSTSREDALFYDKSMISADNVDLDLDYVMDSIDAVISRESFEPGSLYAAMMGGINNVAHGQYDSGNWIYENGGVRWFVDLGADNYNLAGGGLNMGYYKYSTQGNNVVAIASLQDTIPHGQVLDSGGEIVSFVSNEHGSATVIDNSGAYGGAENVTYAKRGMLVTNDRKTVVIQDEIVSVLVQDFYWYAHYDTSRVASCEISDNGRTAIMKSYPDSNGNAKTLRVTLVTANRGFKFEIQDTTSDYFVLDATPKEGYSAELTNGVNDENNRDKYKKLVISGKNTLKFEIAVVIEMIDPSEPEEVGYTLGWDGNANALPPMDEWMPQPDSRATTGGATTDEVELRGTPQLSTIFSNAELLSSYVTKGSYLGADREKFFMALAESMYAINFYGMNQSSQGLIDAIATSVGAKAKYDKFQGKISTDAKNVASIAEGLIGIKTSEPETPPAAE
ncbi:MAG: hypothetical protein IJW48_04905 [Clostridia bacterium]|nr:hypothetical protein [Clostridia bacterium]